MRGHTPVFPSMKKVGVSMFRTTFRVVLTSLLLAASIAAHAADKLVVGGKNFTEQRLMAAMTAEYLKANGFDVDLRTDMGSSLVREAQEKGQIDLYWEYTGTSLITYNKVTDRLTPEETYKRVKELDAQKGIVWLNPSRANDTFALAIRSQDQARLKLKTISDLAAALNAGKQLTLAAGVEFVAREDGLRGLEKAYDFKYSRGLIKQMDIGLTYEALHQGNVDLGMVYSTDGRVGAFQFVVLKDDRNFFPAYALVPVVRADTLKKYPKIGTLMNALSAKLDDPTMQRLNAQVDVDKKTVEQVSHEFLTQQKLI
jgi:osmoprotectant transport system substrate-binding protein